MSKGYKVVRKWKKLPVYGCSKCSFESMREVAVIKHVNSVHRRSTAVREAVVKERRDRFGVPIREAVVAPMQKDMEE